ncbi:bifunctional diaminohydroxyphosphoribosylaminopyrimidine deaminase/5-amino-6-(5-phosphoribosylamino)uracil reductase RibD [Arsenophonus symbiont of Ornithomya chloropus]|uniref:bifunctional diaminohydroxyphosphoribosylaminopyrimidine deaminase/5-amino-6-(5-phosphoribosylamino)uracil reductase RibD n=1 Tax=Arsenophonus symbiont of Ornithomya chloropus TaxID=634121 RepID=UPI003D6D9BE4
MILCHKIFMYRALYLAKKGQFTTSPNPNVGCVIVYNGKIVGEGFHYKAGESHAEINALKMAGKKAQGATAYITLEPCSHYGKTPPCVNALINAGISCVCVSMQDPNPKIQGRGLLKLQKAGIKVLHGLLIDEAEDLNKGFLKRMRTGFPYIQLKLAASLDGKTALASGESKWLTSSEARKDVQTFRAKASAVLTTSSTVINDNPSLNVRWEDFTSKLKNIYPKEQIRQPIRIILDRNNQVTSEHVITKVTGECWLIRSKPILQNWMDHVKEIIIPSYKKGFDLMLVMTQLGKRNINSIFIESGPKLAGSLLQLKLIDELIIYIAPKILGKQAKGLFDIPALEKISNASLFKFINVECIGFDVRLRLKPL